MLGDPQECQDRAARCRELAAHTTDPLARQAHLAVAKKWDELAQEIYQAKAVLMASNMVADKSAANPPGISPDKARGL
jgi:hypothetical protein